jgi:PAS domain S-box-containing protein
MDTFPLRAVVAARDPDAGAALAARVERTGIAVVAVVADADRAIDAVRGCPADVALVAVALPGGGLTATRGIVGSDGGCRVVAVAGRHERGEILQMLLAGAVGYLVEGTPDRELATIVRRAAQAEEDLPVDVMTGLMADLVREISDRTESEARIRRSEERFRGLLEAAPDAVVIVNEEGEIVLVNGQTEMMFGYPREVLLGQPLEFLLPERFHLGHIEHRMAYVSTPRTRRMGTVEGLLGRRMDGREFPVDVSLSTLDTDEGALVIAFVRDLSARERAGASSGRAADQAR